MFSCLGFAEKSDFKCKKNNAPTANKMYQRSSSPVANKHRSQDKTPIPDRHQRTSTPTPTVISFNTESELLHNSYNTFVKHLHEPPRQFVVRGTTRTLRGIIAGQLVPMPVETKRREIRNSVKQSHIVTYLKNRLAKVSFSRPALLRRQRQLQQDVPGCQFADYIYENAQTRIYTIVPRL